MKSNLPLFGWTLEGNSVNWLFQTFGTPQPTLQHIVIFKEIYTDNFGAGDLDLIFGSDPGRAPRRRQLTPVFLPGESHKQRSLVGYSPWGSKELV